MITAIFFRIILLFMEFLKKSSRRFSTKNVCQPHTVTSPFQLRISRASFSPCDWMCCFIAEPLEWQINPPPTDHHLHRTWNYSAGPVWEMRSKSREKHEITEMHFFFLPSQPCIWKLPLRLLHLICARCFTPAQKLRALFCSWPSALLPPQLCSWGTLSHPFQIGLGLNLPCLVSLHASEFHTWYRQKKQLQNEQNMSRQKIFFPSLRVFVISQIWFPFITLWRRDWRRGIGQMEVSIKWRCRGRIGVEAGRWFPSGDWQQLLILAV